MLRKRRNKQLLSIRCRGMLSMSMFAILADNTFSLPMQMTMLQQSLLIHERSVLSALPAPLNAVTILSAPVHCSMLWIAERNRWHRCVSISGTTADQLLGLLLSPVVAVVSWILVLRNQYCDCRLSGWSHLDTALFLLFVLCSPLLLLLLFALQLRDCISQHPVSLRLISSSLLLSSSAKTLLRLQNPHEPHGHGPRSGRPAFIVEYPVVNYDARQIL